MFCERSELALATRSLEEQLQEVIMEESDELKEQLQIKDKTINAILIDSEHNIKIQRELALIKSNSKTNLVYIAETQFEIDGNVESFIKLGETTNIETRAPGLRTEYSKNTYIIDVYPTERCKELEKRLFNNEVINTHLHKMKIKNIQKQEIIKLNTKFTLSALRNIITKTLKDLTEENFKRRKYKS